MFINNEVIVLLNVPGSVERVTSANFHLRVAVCGVSTCRYATISRITIRYQLITLSQAACLRISKIFIKFVKIESFFQSSGKIAEFQIKSF